MNPTRVVVALLGLPEIDLPDDDGFTEDGELSRGGAEAARRVIAAGLTRWAPSMPPHASPGKFCGWTPSERLEHLVAVGRALAPRLLVGDFHSDESQHLVRQLELAAYLPDSDADRVCIGESGCVVSVRGTPLITPRAEVTGAKR